MATTVPVSRHRLTVQAFHKLAEAGVIREDARIELIEGDLINMTPIGSPHAGIVNLLNHMLTFAVGDGAIIGVQNPVVLGDHSEPQPDLLVLKTRDDYYRLSHPTPADILLLVEVADTTIQYDREIKLPLYARYSIPEVWLVDLTKNCLEMHRTPQPKRRSYQQVTLCYEEVVSPALVPAVTVDLAKLFQVP